MNSEKYNDYTFRYKENIKKLASLYKDQMNPPLDTAVWWIEHTIRHNGTEYMKNPLLEYSIIEFYMLDVLTICLAIILLTLIIVIYFIKFLFKFCKKSQKQKIT